jgi:hypothetical protein
MEKRIILTLFLYLMVKAPLFAGDTVRNGRPLFLLFRAGITSNSVSGTMADHNKSLYGSLKSSNQYGFTLSMILRKEFAPNWVAESGLGLIHKQVDPMENSNSQYKDHLNTSYLSIPIHIGFMGDPDTKIGTSMAAGLSFNYKISDNSSSGPDRLEFRTPSTTVSFDFSVKISYRFSDATSLVLGGDLQLDLNNAYVETLYQSPAEPNKEYNYKYSSSSISLGMQLRIR